MNPETTYPAIRLIISGGGTGGHLYPAIAIAQKVKELSPASDILFVGAKGKLEMEKVPKHGFPIKGLWISGYQRGSILKNLSLPLKLLSSLASAWGIISSFKPQIAVGVGGYASAALLYVAGKRNIPYLIQEQNSFPGITNKLLSKGADKICVAYGEMDRYFPKEKLEHTGNPIRQEMAHVDKAEAKQKLGFESNKPLVVSIGGSLGARTLNEAWLANSDELLEKGIQLLWQTGSYYFNEINEKLVDQSHTQELQATAFIEDMGLAYAAADLVISRAGALSISEICALGKASILVPSPNVAEDHQTKNASFLAERNAAVLVKDKDAKEQLVAKAISLANDETSLLQLEKTAGDLAIDNSSERIAKLVFGLASKN